MWSVSRRCVRPYTCEYSNQQMTKAHTLEQVCRIQTFLKQIDIAEALDRYPKLHNCIHDARDCTPSGSSGPHTRRRVFRGPLHGFVAFDLLSCRNFFVEDLCSTALCCMLHICNFPMQIKSLYFSLPGWDMRHTAFLVSPNTISCLQYPSLYLEVGLNRGLMGETTYKRT